MVFDFRFIFGWNSKIIWHRCTASSSIPVVCNQRGSERRILLVSVLFLKQVWVQPHLDKYIESIRSKTSMSTEGQKTKKRTTFIVKTTDQLPMQKTRQKKVTSPIDRNDQFLSLQSWGRKTDIAQQWSLSDGCSYITLNLTAASPQSIKLKPLLQPW